MTTTLSAEREILEGKIGDGRKLTLKEAVQLTKDAERVSTWEGVRGTTDRASQK